MTILEVRHDYTLSDRASDMAIGDNFVFIWPDFIFTLFEPGCGPAEKRKLISSLTLKMIDQIEPSMNIWVDLDIVNALPLAYRVKIQTAQDEFLF